VKPLRDLGSLPRLFHFKGDPMKHTGLKRKLTAVFSADVAGYSRLMVDESATVQNPRGVQADHVLTDQAAQGWVIDSPGGQISWPSLRVWWTLCSAGLPVQKGNSRHATPTSWKTGGCNSAIGINLGDVIEEQDRLYGDGVNMRGSTGILCRPRGDLCLQDSF